MAAKLSEGDTVGLTAEVTIIHDDGSVTVHVHGYSTPVTLGSEHLSLIAKRKSDRRTKPLFDKPD